MVNDRKITHLAEKSKYEKNNGEQSDVCDLEQVALKSQLQADRCLWYLLAANMVPYLAMGR